MAIGFVGIAAVVGDRLIPRFDDAGDILLVRIRPTCFDDDDIGDQAGRGGAVDQQVTEIGGLALGEPGLPGHRRIDALGDEGAAGIARGHVDGIQIGFLQAGLAKQHVQVEFRHRAFVDSDLPALQVGDRRDVLDRDDAVAAVGIIDRHDILEIVRLLQIEQRGVDRAGDHLDLVGHQRGEALLRVLHDDQVDIDAVLLEQALVLRDVERAVADPGGVRDLDGVGPRRRPHP